MATAGCRLETVGWRPDTPAVDLDDLCRLLRDIKLVLADTDGKALTLSELPYIGEQAGEGGRCERVVDDRDWTFYRRQQEERGENLRRDIERIQELIDSFALKIGRPYL